MGYYTYFQLEVEGGPAEQRCPTCGHIGEWDWAELIAKFLGAKYDPNHGEYDPFQESCKWYEYEADMIEFSQIYPDFVFIIEGNGEEDDDRWRHYFRNGNHHKDHMEMSFPHFDVESLK